MKAPTCTSSAAHLVGHEDSVKSLYHIDGGGCDYAKGTGSSAQRLHAILADRSCRTQGPGDAPPVCTGASCAQGYQSYASITQFLVKNRPPPGSRSATPLRCVSPPLSRRHRPFRHLLRLAAAASLVAASLHRLQSSGHADMILWSAWGARPPRCMYVCGVGVG